MNLLVKIMDKDSKTFELLSARSPAKAKVYFFNDAYRIKLIDGVSGEEQARVIYSEVYVMNEDGQTVSKTVLKDLLRGHGIQEMLKATASLLQPVRELGAVHIDDSENRDHGTILKTWEKHNNEIGAYFDGFFKGAEAITSVMIRQFKVFAKSETIEALRKEGDWSEAKLAMLEANDKVVNPTSVKVEIGESSVTLRTNGDIELTSSKTMSTSMSDDNPVVQLKLWEKVFGHLNEEIAANASQQIESLLFSVGDTIRGVVTNSPVSGVTLTLLKDRKIVNAYSKTLAIKYSPEKADQAIRDLFDASVNKNARYETYEFKRNDLGVLISEIPPLALYACYEQDVLERDANGQVVFDDKGNSVIKHKKGDVILSDLLSVQSQPSPGYLG